MCCKYIGFLHYNDVIMSATASQITSLTIVYSTICLGADEKTSKLLVTGLCAGNSPVTGEFPAHRASKAENVSIWWRHHGNLIYSWDNPLSYISFVQCCQIQPSLSSQLVNSMKYKTQLRVWESVPTNPTWRVSVSNRVSGPVAWKFTFLVFCTSIYQVI